MTYQCYYDQTIDQSVAATNACSSLPGTATFSTSTGQLSWSPLTTSLGIYEIKVTGSKNGNSDSKIVVVAVRPAYVTTNLLSYWDSLFADQHSPKSGSYGSLKDLSGNSNHGSLSSTTNASWSGSGTYASPYQLAFNGSGSVDASSVASSASKFAFSTWVNPSQTSKNEDSVLFSNNNNASGNGITLRHKPGYADYVLSLNPVSYWRLGETSGTTATDLGSGGNHGTYGGAYTLGVAGAPAADSNGAATFYGTTGAVTIGNVLPFERTDSFTISAWFKTGTTGKKLFAKMNNSGSGYRGYSISVETGDIYFDLVSNWGTTNAIEVKTPLATYVNSAWHHLVVTYSGTSLASGVSMYVDGSIITPTVLANNLTATIVDTTPLYIGTFAGGLNFNGSIDDVAVYNYVLTATQASNLYKAGTSGKVPEFIVGQRYKDLIQSFNPIGYYRLGESSGTTVTDESTNALHGTYYNSPTLLQTGAITSDANNSINLNGSSQYATLPNSSTFDPGTGTYTILGWFKTSATYGSAGYILHNYGSGVIPSVSLGVNSADQKLYAMLRDGGGNMVSVTGQGSAVNDGTWHFAALVRDSQTSIKVYLDGSLLGSSSTPGMGSITFSGLGPFSIGRRSGNNDSYFNGQIDEIALFNSALTATQISNLYNAGVGNLGGGCTSSLGLQSDTWNFISGLFDGSSLKLYVNGRVGCSINSVTQGYASPATNMTIGSTTSAANGYKGSLTELLLYGSSNGSSVPTQTNLKSNFDVSSDRYRENPQFGTVTANLLVNLDAANASQGLRPFTNGCFATDLSWFDLSSSSLTGTLTNFASCSSTSGWYGSGTTSSPYRLAFDGTNDYVNLGTGQIGTLGNGASGFTVNAWIRYAALDSGALDNVVYVSRLGNSTLSNIYLNIRGDGVNVGKISLGARSQAADTYQSLDSTQALTANTWYYVTGVINYTTANISLYVNGALSNTGSATFGSTTYVHSGTPTQPDSVSSTNYVATYPYQGDLAALSVYNSALSASQIYQNCQALVGRFSGVSCSQ
jgi:hypothetical protein